MMRSLSALALAVTLVASSATGAAAFFGPPPPTPEGPPAPQTITATLDVYPGTINLKSNGKYVAAYIELSAGYDVADIVVSSVILAGECRVDPKKRAKIGDKDEDGIPDLRVIFSRKDLKKSLDAGGLTELTIDGLLLDGSSFSGTDVVRILK